MAKQTQSKSLGSLNDFISTEPEPENDRYTALEKRVSTLELLLNDVMHQLDQPQNEPRTKQKSTPPERNKDTGSKKRARKKDKDKPKPTPPSEIIAELLKDRPLTAAEIESETGMDTASVEKCLNYMKRKNLVKERDNSTYELNKEHS